MPVSEKTSTWKVAASGSFWVAANWTNGVPNASTDALITALGTYTVSSAETGVIDSLSLAAGATLAITDSSTLTVTDGTDGLTSYTNYGWIKVGLGSALNIGKAFTDSGGRIYSVGDTTISDATLKLSNSAVITSDGGVVTLSHDNIVMDSSSQLRGGVPGAVASANEVLDIIDNAIRGGQVLDRDGSIYVDQVGSVYLTDDRLYGVYMDGPYNQDVFHVEGLSNLFDGVTTPMIITCTVTVEDGAALTLSGAIHTVSTGVNTDYDIGGVDDALSSDTEPEIVLNSTGTASNNAELLIKGAVTLSGQAPPPQQPGYFPTYNNAVQLSDNPNNVIDGSGIGHAVLTNVNDVIQGSGHIGLGDGSLSVINKFWIDSDGDDYGLYIDTGSHDAVGILTNNNGVLESSFHGDLHLVNTDVDGGYAEIADAGSMELQGSTHLSVQFAGYIQLYGVPYDNITESLTLDTPFDHSFTTGGSTITFDTNNYYGGFDDDLVNLVGLNFVSGSTHATYTWSSGPTGLLEVTNGSQIVDLTIGNGGGVNRGEFSVLNYAADGQTGTTVKFVA